jgi:hypothetical protein
MVEPVMSGLLWFSAIGCGLLSGLYLAFSTFIMTALGHQLSRCIRLRRCAVGISQAGWPVMAGSNSFSLRSAVRWCPRR